jgi:RimJ/RimL family protein N-acetyltransferase
VTRVRGLVQLRGFRPEEVDEAVRRLSGATPDVDATARRRRRVERSGRRNDWEVLFALEAEGRLVGAAQARCSETVMPPGVWEIGVELWRESDRGRGLGREAVRMLAGHLFAREGAIRVQASTDVENLAMRRALEAAEFGLEGVLRGFMPTADGPRDYAMYAMTRAEWEAR